MSKPFTGGAYAHQRLNLVGDGKAHRRNAKASNRTWEIRPYGIIGGLGKRGHGGIVNPPRNRKGEIGNPSPTASALEFYPNVREPDALVAHVRFDERDVETGHGLDNEAPADERAGHR